MLTDSAILEGNNPNVTNKDTTDSGFNPINNQSGTYEPPESLNEPFRKSNDIVSQPSSIPVGGSLTLNLAHDKGSDLNDYRLLVDSTQ
jgi:hypothetical protein